MLYSNAEIVYLDEKYLRCMLMYFAYCTSRAQLAIVCVRTSIFMKYMPFMDFIILLMNSFEWIKSCCRQKTEIIDYSISKYLVEISKHFRKQNSAFNWKHANKWNFVNEIKLWWHIIINRPVWRTNLWIIATCVSVKSKTRCSVPGNHSITCVAHIRNKPVL